MQKVLIQKYPQKKKSKLKLDQMSSHCESDMLIYKFGHSFWFWGAFIDFTYSDDFEFAFQYHTPNLRGVKILPKLSEISQKALYDFKGFSFTL